MPPTRILVALDIEKAGCLLKGHPVISIGFVVGNDEGVIYERVKVNFRVRWPQDFEERCYKEFWAKNPEAVKMCQVDPEPLEYKQAWQKVGEFVDSLEKRFPFPDFKVTFLSDNPSFDIANVDLGLEEYCQRMPLRYERVSGRYRSVQDPTEQLRLFSDEEQKAIREAAKAKSPHNHCALSDAGNIYWLYVITRTCKPALVMSHISNGEPKAK